MKLPQHLLENPKDSTHWDTQSFHAAWDNKSASDIRSTERWLKESELLPAVVAMAELEDSRKRPIRQLVANQFADTYRKKKYLSLTLQLFASPLGPTVLMAADAKSGRRWCYLPANPDQADLQNAFGQLLKERNAILWPSQELHGLCRELIAQTNTHTLRGPNDETWIIGMFAFQEPGASRPTEKPLVSSKSGHLEALEAESIHIMREVVSQADNPVMLYSLGKDSSVMLRLAQKAFAPSKPPFPLLHVDTRWKFQAMYEFREQIAAETGMEIIRHVNPEGIEKDINPFDHGSELHTHIMKTEGLKQALDEHKFDVAFGGARRDEEKSRAKERVFSFRSPNHAWDPKNQRPELWNQYNGYKKAGESIRVFPLSNWTEQNIWEYIYRESIPIVPLYFAQERPVVMRDGTWFMLDDDRFRLNEDDKIELKKVRFRTLGCYPLTGAIESDAAGLGDIVIEVLTSRTSERQGRKIDSDTNASMEKKKLEGYF